MTDNKFQKIVTEQLNKIAKELGELKKGQAEFKTGLQRLDGKVDRIDKKADDIIDDIQLNREYINQAFERIGEISVRDMVRASLRKTRTPKNRLSAK